MTRFILIALLAAPAVPAAAADLKCEDIRPRVKSVTVMTMEPVRRGKTWTPKEQKTALRTACDPHGMKTEESEYHQKTRVIDNRFVYKSREESRLICANLKSEERITSTFSQEARSSLDDFCRKNRKKDYDLVLVYDRSSDTGSERPIRRVFRLYNSKGFPSEEYEFDAGAGLESRTSYKYDSANNLLERTEHDLDGNQLKRETHAFNKAAAARETTVYNENNQLARRTVREYRENDTLRRETATTYDAGEQALSRTVINCDAKGARVSELFFQGDMETPAYEYRYSHEFDPKGNWTEERKVKLTVYGKKRFEDPNLAPQITKRTIVYY